MPLHGLCSLVDASHPHQVYPCSVSHLEYMQRKCKHVKKLMVLAGQSHSKGTSFVSITGLWKARSCQPSPGYFLGVSALAAGTVTSCKGSASVQQMLDEVTCHTVVIVFFT